MSSNPYSPPKSQQLRAPEIEPAWAKDRAAAVRRVRLTIAILAVPAFVNVYFFNLGPPRGNSTNFAYSRSSIDTVFYATNTVMLTLLLLFLWFKAVGLLEYVAKLIKRVFGIGVPTEAWLTTLYDASSRYSGPHPGYPLPTWFGIFSST